MFLNIMDHVSAIVPEWAANILPRDLLFRFSLDCLRASRDPARGAGFPTGRAVFWTAQVLFSGRLTISFLAALIFPPTGLFLGLPVVFSPGGWPFASSRLAFSILLGQSPRFQKSG